MRILTFGLRKAQRHKLYLFSGAGAVIEEPPTREELLEWLEADAAQPRSFYNAIVLKVRRTSADIELIRRTAQIAKRVPVVALTEIGGHERGTRQYVRCLDAGAIASLSDKVAMERLMAVLRALNRFAHGRPGETILSFGPLTVHLNERMLRWTGIPIRLTRKEWSFMEYVALKKGCVATAEGLMQQLYGLEDESVGAKILDTYACYIRKKMRQAGCPNPLGTLLNVPGEGYRLIEPIKIEEAERMAKTAAPGIPAAPHYEWGLLKAAEAT